MDSNQKSKLPIGPEEYIITEQKQPETRINTGSAGSDQRAAFEAWISSPPRNHKISRSGERAMYPGRYEYYEAQIAWEAWQAALQSQPVKDGWKEAVRAWEVCASIHREFCKGKDTFFNTRQSDFVRHADDARKRFSEPDTPKTQPQAEPSEWIKQHEALMHRVSKAALVVGYGGTINGAPAEQALENAEKALLDHALALQSQDRVDASCTWHNDPETDNSWSTDCRQLFEIYDGTPTENKMGFCCYCGKPIREAIDRIEGE